MTRTGYRQMRRQARQARRAGMQPMMVINTGNPFPEIAIVVIARWAWRYRSELAPLGVAGAAAGVGWRLRTARYASWRRRLIQASWVRPGIGASGAALDLKRQDSALDHVGVFRTTSMLRS